MWKANGRTDAYPWQKLTWPMARWAKKTSLLYFKSYCSCCTQINIPLVPLSDLNLTRYIAFLSGSLCFKSIQNYLSVINLLHKETQIPSPINSHYIQGVLWEVKRLLEDTCHPKFPITPAILQGFFSNLNVGHSSDIIFWAVCLVDFFSFIRKWNLFVPSQTEFDPARHLSREAVVFHKDGVILSIIKTKTIQNTERVLKIHLPRIPGSLVCPAQALLLSFKMAPANNSCSPAFLYKNSIKVIPLTYSVFLSTLKRFLSVLGINNTLYSGHSFRWGKGGASFALECGVPSELIQSR